MQVVDEPGRTTKGDSLPSLRHEGEKGDIRDEDSSWGPYVAILLALFFAIGGVCW